MSTTRQSSVKNLTKKENLSDQALVAGVSVDIGTPGADLLNSLPSEPQAKFKNKKATDAELNKEEQQDSASNLKVADVELTEVVMVDATSVALELTADVKKDCKINSKGVEECSDGGAGWWWAAGLPLLALGGGGGGGGGGAVVTPVTTSNYRHEDFVQNRSDLDDDVLVIDNTSNSIVQVFLDGGEHDEEGTWQASESNSWDSSNWDAQRDILVTKIADLGTAEDLLAADQAVLDPLLVDLADAEDILDAAQADLDALPDGDSGIAAAQAAVDAAQADVDTAQAAVAAAQADVDTAQAAVDAAEGDVTMALENLIIELNDSDDNFEGAAIWSATVLDLQAAIDDGDDSAVEGLVEDLLVVLQDVDTEYLQAINFEGSDNIRDFRLFVENSDTVELGLDFSAALDLTSILVDVSEDSEIYMSGGGTLVSVVGLDNLDITINISDDGRIKASGGGTLVAVSGGDNLDIAINVTDGGRITLLHNNNANLVVAAGDNINVNLTVDDATLNFSGGAGGSPAIFVAGDDSDVNVEFINDSGITVSQQGEDSNFVYIDGNQSVVNFTIDDTYADFNLSGGGYLPADREFSGGQYNSSIIEAGSSIVAVSGDDATINFTVENNSNLYVSGGENVSSVIAVEGDNANITVTSLNNYSGGIMLSGGGDVVNVIGHNASVHLVVGNDAEGETYSGSSFIQTRSADHSDIVRIFGNDALVDIDMSRNSEIGVNGSGGDVVNITGDDATIDVNIEALDENGSSYILLGNSSGGSLNNDPKNIFAINGDDATVNLDALIESGNLDIQLSGGDAIDILGDRANVTINLTAQLDENGPVLNDYNEPDIDIQIYDGGDFVHVTGDDAVVNITATANVDVQDPDPTGGEIIDFRIDGSGASVVTVEGDDAEINLTLVGGVDIDGFEIAQVYGDNASVTLTANDSMVLGSSDQFLDIEVSGGISVFGNNASVAFNATGTIVQNQIKWDDDQSLVSVSSNDSVLDSGSEITVAIDNAWMSGGFIAEINGNKAQVTVDLREVEGYTGGVKLNGNNSDIDFIADSSEMRLDGAGVFSGGGFSGGGFTDANDVAAQFLSIDGDDNDYRFVFNDINSLFIEPSVDIFEVNGVGNSGSIVVSNSTFNTSGGFGEDTNSVDQANFLAVYGDDNTSLITLNNSSMDFSQGSFITVDGNNNDTTLNIIKSDLYLSGGSFGEDTVIATELFSIDGNDNSLIVNVTSPSAVYDSFLEAASDYSEVSGNNNTIDVNFLRNGDGDLGLEIQGDNNTLNLNFDKQELNAKSTVTFDLIEANSTEINIDGKRTTFAIGWANGNHDGSFIDGDDTVINIDLENNSIMALDTTLATGVNLDTTTTVNIDSDDSVFALEFYVENGHTLDINLNGVDQNSLFNNSNDLSSYLELITDADGVINITNQPNVDAIDTIIYGSGTVDLEVSNVHNVGNYDHIYIDDSRHLDVYDFEVEYDEIHLATNLYANVQQGANYGSQSGVNWFDLDVYGGNYDLLQDVADFYYQNYGGAVLFTDSGAAPTFNPGTDFDDNNTGLEYLDSGGFYERDSNSLEATFGTNIYYMSWNGNVEGSLGDLSIYKWLDDSYSWNGSQNIDDPYAWTLMATIHEIENPANYYGDGTTANDYVDAAYGSGGYDDHFNNNISDFTTVDSYLDRWTVYGV